MKSHIAIDIGGTQMRAASYNSQSLVPIKINRIQSKFTGEKPQERLVQVVRSIWPNDTKVESIGIAVAGPLDLHAGIIEKSPNIPDFDNFPICKYLENRFDVPVFLGNDANLAALGEWKYGAGQGITNLIYLTISTGIGSGVIADGRLLLGNRGMAAELGHVTIVPDGPICSCGKRGHLEAFSSGTAIAKWVTEQLRNGRNSTIEVKGEITAQDVAIAANTGDPLALAAFERAGKILGIAIVNFLHIFNPARIIFGGGVSKSFDLLLPHINKALKKDVFAPGYLEGLTLTTVALGDDSGLLGALALAREAQIQT
jgi:glucokinase